MRFLFVYQDYARQAEGLLDQLGVRDVEIIIARKNATAPTAQELQKLIAHRGAAAAACEITRKYRKTIDPYVTLCCEPKKFRIEDQQLREWLVPKDRAEVTHARPSVSVAEEANKCPNLIVHPGALLTADSLAEHRWGFVAEAIRLLARYANGEQLGALRDWRGQYGIDFAPNGRVSYRYSVTCGAETTKGATEWHLKQGDNTTAESAARIYFERTILPPGARVLIFYVGPHPADGETSVSFFLSA